MRIAVVIPCYNRADYTLRTVRSIYAQTRLPDRIIVVDDGSDDDTVARLKTHFTQAFPPLEVIVQANSGPAAARNNGINLAADCEWIALCDSDDLWHPEKLAHQESVIHATRYGDKLGCVYCNNGHIDAQDNRLPNCGYAELRGFIGPQVLAGRPITGSMSAVMIRRRDWLACGKFDENLQRDEDLEFFIRLSGVAAFDYVPEILTFIRCHDDKRSNDTEKLLASKSYIFTKHRDKLGKLAPLVNAVRLGVLRDCWARYRNPLATFAQARTMIHRNCSQEVTTLLWPSWGWVGLWLVFIIPCRIGQKLWRWGRQKYHPTGLCP